MTDFTPERLRELADKIAVRKDAVLFGGLPVVGSCCLGCDLVAALRAGADAMKLRNDLFALVAGWHAYHADPNNETLAPHETIRDWAERKYKEAHSG